MPFFGITVLLMQAFGFPQRNFDKSTAELFKTHYYSFLLLISLAFLLSFLIKNFKIVGIIFSIIIVFCSSFLYGVPGNGSEAYEEYLNLKNKWTDTCIVNSFFIKNFDFEDCNKKR